MSIALDRVEAKLASEWEKARPSKSPNGAPESHARTANMVALCSDPADHDRVRSVLAKLVLRHPGRGLLVIPSDPDGPHASITAREVEIVSDPDRRNEPVSELVTLDVKGAARAWVPTAVERLLTPGAPTHLWWVGDLPDHDTLFDRLVEPSDSALFDSSVMDLRDLPSLALITERAQGNFSVGDLGWSWLRLWQDLLARFFDEPESRADLSRVTELRVCCAPHRLEPIYEPASPQGALYAGWLLSRLGADATDAQWTVRSGDERVLTAPTPDREITVRFTTEPREKVPTGALLRVSMHTPDSAYTVARDVENPVIFGWSAEVRGTSVAPAVWRGHPPDESVLLARALDVPAAGRVVFVRSLRAAAALARAAHNP